MGDPKGLKGSQWVWRDPSEFEGIPVSLKGSQWVWRDPNEFVGIPVSLKGSQWVWRDPRELGGFQGFRGIPLGYDSISEVLEGSQLGLRDPWWLEKIPPTPTQLLCFLLISRLMFSRKVSPTSLKEVYFIMGHFYHKVYN